MASGEPGRTEVPGRDLEKFFSFLSLSFLFSKGNLTYLMKKSQGLNRETSVPCLVRSASWWVFSTCSSLPLHSYVTLPMSSDPTSRGRGAGVVTIRRFVVLIHSMI